METVSGLQLTMTVSYAVPQREGGVHARVVELDALADPVGPRPEDEDRRPLARGDLGLVVVGRVVVRRAGRELRGAGVHRLVDRTQRRARAAAGAPSPRPSRAARRSARRTGRAAWPAAAARGPARRPWRPASATSLISRTWSRNHGSMPVASYTSATLAPPVAPTERSTCWTWMSRCSVGTRIAASSVGQRLAGRDRAVPVEHRPALVDRAHRLAERLGEAAARGPSPRRPTSWWWSASGPRRGTSRRRTAGP